MSSQRPNKHGQQGQIAAVVAAAGLSRRMGRPKQLLPWGKKTVLKAVVDSLATAGATPIVCVLGHLAQQMRQALHETDAICIENTRYQQGEMLSSYQAGIRYLLSQTVQTSGGGSHVTGALLALSDQPHVPPAAIRAVIERALNAPNAIVIPSYNMRRGHPIYLPRRLWTELLDLPAESSLRGLIQAHENQIQYAIVESNAVLRDMDTPAEYSARLDESGISGKESNDRR